MRSLPMRTGYVKIRTRTSPVKLKLGYALAVSLRVITRGALERRFSVNFRFQCDTN